MSSTAIVVTLFVGLLTVGFLSYLFTFQKFRRFVFQLLNGSKMNKFAALPGPIPEYPSGSIDKLLEGPAAPWINATRLSEKYNSGAVLIWAHGTPMVVLNDPKLIGEVLEEKDVKCFRKDASHVAPVLGPHDPFSCNPEDYLRLKKQHPFEQEGWTSQWLPQQVSSVRKLVFEHLKVLAGRSGPNKTTFKLLLEVQRMCFDTVSMSLLGRTLGNEAHNDLHRLGTIADERIKSPFLKKSLPMWCWSDYNSVLQRWYGRFQKALDEGYASPDANKTDLVNFLARVRPDKKYLPDEVGETLHSSVYSVASGIISILDALASAPEVLQRLQRELSTKLRGPFEYTWEDLDSCLYLECVVREALRLKPPMPFLSRRATQGGVEVAGVSLDKDQPVIMSTWLSNHDTRYYDNPYQFNPDRWLNETYRKNNPYHSTYFCPFGRGQRHCIGYRLGLLNMKVVTAAVVLYTELFVDASSWQDNYFFLVNMPYSLRASLALRPEFPTHVADLVDVPPITTVTDRELLDESKNRGSYKIVIKTSTQRHSGTDATITIQLIGEAGQSDPKVLDNLFVDDFEQGQTDTFEVDFGQSYGDLGAIHFTSSATGFNTNWLPEWTRVLDKSTGRSYMFPATGWVGATGRTFFEGTARLPRDTPAFVKELRAAQLALKRESYGFDVYNDLGTPTDPRPTLLDYPRRINHVRNDMPDDEKFSVTKFKDFAAMIAKGLVGKTGSNIIGMVAGKSWDSLADNNRLFQLAFYPLPDISQRWQDDEEYGRQRLGGLNPVVVALVSDHSVLNEMTLTDAHVEGVLPAGETLDSALSKKRLLVVNYRAVAPLLPKLNADRFHCSAPITLFYSPDKKALKPIAIQLLPDGVIYTPKDNKWVWLLAKTYAAEVDTGFHQLFSHWVRTHASTEPYVVAWTRQISEMHPIFKLMRPHFRYTLAINAAARARLVQAGGHIEQAFFTGKYSMETSATFYKMFWNFKHQSLPEDIAQRGLTSKDIIEEYPYRDDGLEVWGAIERYITSAVRLYYKSDADVTQDTELVAWYDELRTEGHPIKKDTFPELTGIEALVRVLTTMVWIVSGHHAAVNFAQYSYSSYMPNHPVDVSRPPPEADKDRIYTEKDFMDSLSTQQTAALVLSVTFTLSSFAEADEEEYLGDPQVKMFIDPEALMVLDDFLADLKRVDKLLKERNSTRKIPYPFLQPSQIPGSIAI